MSNTGHKWIYKVKVKKLTDPVRYKVRIYYKSENVDVGMYRTLEEALKRRNQFMKEHNIEENRLREYNTRNENID